MRSHLRTLLRVLALMDGTPRHKILAGDADISSQQLTVILRRLKVLGVRYESVRLQGYRVLDYGIFNIDRVQRLALEDERCLNPEHVATQLQARKRGTTA